MKRLLGALFVIALLGACSGGAERYGSAPALAAALRAGEVSCEGYEPGAGAELLSDRASCTSGSTELDIYLFDDERARERWLRVGAGLEGVVVGPNWVVEAGDRAEEVAEALEGELR